MIFWLVSFLFHSFNSLVSREPLSTHSAEVFTRIVLLSVYTPNFQSNKNFWMKERERENALESYSIFVMFVWFPKMHIVIHGVWEALLQGRRLLEKNLENSPGGTVQILPTPVRSTFCLSLPQVPTAVSSTHQLELCHLLANQFGISFKLTHPTIIA